MSNSPLDGRTKEIIARILRNVVCESEQQTVPENTLLKVLRREVDNCTSSTLNTILTSIFPATRKLTFQSEVLYSGISLRMSSLLSLAKEWESDMEKPIFNTHTSSITSPGSSDQSRWSLVLKSTDFYKWVLYCSELDIREISVYRNMSWKVWSGEHTIKPDLLQNTSPFITSYIDFKSILLLVQNGKMCTGIPRSHTSPKRRRTASRHSDECDRIIFGGGATGTTLAAEMGLIGGSACQNCHRSADTADKFLEVVEIDGKVTKNSENIENLQEIVQSLKSEVDQLKRDHCAIMQYLINIPPSANQKLAFQSPSTKVRSAIHSYRASTSLENSPDELVNAIALAIQNRPGSEVAGRQTAGTAAGDTSAKSSEYDDIMRFGEDISIAKSQLYSIITKARNCAHPQTKLITMLVKNLIPDYEGKSYTRLDPNHTNILRSLYFTVFPVEVDETVVDDDMRERIKTRIEEEIWQKLKVTITDCCRKAKPKPVISSTAPPAAPSGYYPTLPASVISTGSRSISPSLSQAINSHIFSTLSHQTFSSATGLGLGQQSPHLSMITSLKTENNHL